MNERTNSGNNPLEKARQVVARIDFIKQEVPKEKDEITVFDKLIIELKEGKISPEKALERAENIFRAIGEAGDLFGKLSPMGSNDYEPPTLLELMKNLRMGNVLPEDALKEIEEIRRRKNAYSYH